MLSCFSLVWLFATPWTVACQAPLSMESSRQEYWSGLPCPLPEDLPSPRIKTAPLMSPVLGGGLFTTSATWDAFAFFFSPCLFFFLFSFLSFSFSLCCYLGTILSRASFKLLIWGNQHSRHKMQNAKCNIKKCSHLCSPAIKFRLLKVTTYNQLHREM